MRGGHGASYLIVQTGLTALLNRSIREAAVDLAVGAFEGVHILKASLLPPTPQYKEYTKVNH